MRRYYFERLEVWTEAKDFGIEIFRLSERFPATEQYGVTNQIRRAAFSISANIAEGISRNTNKDKARFINQAYSSAIEVLNFLIIAKELDWFEMDDYQNLRLKIESITNKLNALYSKLITNL